LRGHKGFVASVVFSPEGHTLASAGADGTVRLWDVSRTKKLAQAVQGGVGVVLSVAFSPDGTTLAFGGDDGSVRLWDVRGSAPLGEPLIGHRDRVQSVAFSPNGLTLASAGADSTVRLWDGIFWRDSDDLRDQVCRLVVGNLTSTEWSEVIPDEDYRPTCTS
jgi:WD40 repeat protein